jgi:hypothetical protein
MKTRWQTANARPLINKFHKYISRKCGFETTEPLMDLRDQSSSLDEISTRTEIKPALIRLPLSLCRANGLPLSHQPYSLGLTAIMGQNREEESLKKWLSAYFTLLAKFSASDLMGISPGDCLPLDKEPPRGLYFPWQDLSIQDHYLKILNCFREESLREGVNYIENSLAITDNWVKAHVQQHSRRLLRLRDAIKKNGYQRHDGHDGDCCGTILIGDGGRACWLIGSGIHRLAVAHHLGFTEIPARVIRIVRRTEAAYWPGVKSGTFRIEIALRVFDRIIAGNPAENHTSLLKQISRNSGVGDLGH